MSMVESAEKLSQQSLEPSGAPNPTNTDQQDNPDTLQIEPTTTSTAHTKNSATATTSNQAPSITA